MSTEAYRDGEARIAERHWEKTLCVVSGSDNYAIHAWVCGEPGKLWHVYVSPGLRRAGVASELVQSVSGTSAQVHKPLQFGLLGVLLFWNPWMVMQ
jgi:GNAT superfamily N-acetyltransferase